MLAFRLCFIFVVAVIEVWGRGGSSCGSGGRGASTGTGTGTSTGTSTSPIASALACALAARPPTATGSPHKLFQLRTHTQVQHVRADHKRHSRPNNNDYNNTPASLP